MAEGDIWCELCEDKPKQVAVQYYGRRIGICSHCASMYIEKENTINHSYKKNEQLIKNVDDDQ